MNEQLLDALDTAETMEEVAENAVHNALSTMEESFGLVKNNLLLKKGELDKKAVEELAPIVNIESDEQLKTVRRVLTDAGKSIKEVSEMRLNTTRPIDAFKKEIISVEKEICANLQTESDRVKGLADSYEVTEAKRRKEEQEKLQREIDKNNEVERVRIALKSEASIKFDRFVANVVEELKTRFSKLTLADFDSNISLLNNYKPILKEDAYDSFFVAYYNNALIQGDEYLKLQRHAKVDIPLQVFQERYAASVNAVVSEIKAMVPARKKELQDLADLEEKNAEEARRIREENERKANDEREKRAQAAKEEEDRKRKEAEQQTSQQQLQSQLSTQSKMQAVGPVSVKKSLMKASVTIYDAYKELVSFYIKSGGDISKLEFLADFAAKNGQPKITGVTYNV
ncbi:hypothetical protein ABDK00_014225 [Niabella insulamsoli]|uniref:hypothetical protein n=1 Tax=Niabella insulamsoli TaxID=3144874 RepID=UPI0031FE1C8A